MSGAFKYYNSSYAIRNGSYGFTISIPGYSSHTHNFTYEASGNTITASCGEGCNITSGKTLTISAPENLTFDYEPKVATLNNNYNTTAFPGTYAIEYYQGTTKLSGAPVNAGSYRAQVTAGGQTASVDFTISGRDPVSYLTKTKSGNNWLIQRQTITEYLNVESKSDSYYLMQDGRTYVVKGNQTLSKGLVYQGTVYLILCANSSLTIKGGIWHLGSELHIYAEEGAEETATVSVEGTTEQPALSGGTIIMHSGKLLATPAEGGQIAGTGLVLLLDNGVKGDNLSGGEVQDNGMEKYTATQLNNLTSLTLTTPVFYTVTLADGTEDATNWTIEPNPAEKDQTVTITYTGTKRVKSVTAVEKAAAPAPATITVTWNSVYCYGTYTQDGVTLTPSNGQAVNGNNFYEFGNNTFTTTLGKFTKIEIVCESSSNNIDGWTKETAEQYQPDPENQPTWWEDLYKLTWTGDAESVTIQGKDVFGIHSITFTIQ